MGDLAPIPPEALAPMLGPRELFRMLLLDSATRRAYLPVFKMLYRDHLYKLLTEYDYRTWAYGRDTSDVVPLERGWPRAVKVLLQDESPCLDAWMNTRHVGKVWTRKVFTWRPATCYHVMIDGEDYGFQPQHGDSSVIVMGEGPPRKAHVVIYALYDLKYV